MKRVYRHGKKINCRAAEGAEQMQSCLLSKIYRKFGVSKQRKSLCFLCALCGFAVNLLSLDASETLDEDAVMVVDSDVADYNGKKITLSGHVVVEHELGVISANWIEVIPQTIDKKVRFNTLTMKEDVEVALKDGGQLSCANAILDYIVLQGQFEGTAQQQYVVYTENCPDKAGASVPLTVKSKHLLVKIDQSKSTVQHSHSCISAMTANDSVTVNYNHDFIAAADLATYHRLPQENWNTSANQQMPGLVTLRAAEENALCQVTNRNGDMIQANTICIDIVKRQLFFVYPKGVIYTLSDTGKQNRVDFTGDTMTWDDQKNVLTLCDHVVVSQQGIGQLNTEKEIRFFQYPMKGMKRLRSIESTGPTTLVYTDEEKELVHTLICYGLLLVDHEHLQTVMESPRDEYGNVIEGCQVHFQDHMGEIYADKMVIKYEIVNHSPSPTKMILEGHVRLMNRCAVDMDKQGPYLQYALADKVEYTPHAKEVSLTANGKGRILFFDKLNNLQVSAPGLKIRRDQTTKKESIQGIGNVRFSFVEKELEEMSKYFQL